MTLSNAEVIQKFRKILHYGNSKFLPFKLIVSKYRLKKRLLHLMLCAHQSYSEAILKLIDPAPAYDKAAEAIFRSIFENYINVNYLYSDRTQKNANLFLSSILHDSNDFAENYKKFMAQHPTWKLDFGNIKTPADWDRFIGSNNKQIDTGLKSYGLTHLNALPNLRARARYCDSALAQKGKLTQKRSLEKLYVQYYRHFSQPVHLGAPGLGRFYTYFPQTDRLSVDGGPESANQIISVTYIYYCVVLRHALKEFKLFDKTEFKEFDDFAKKLSK